MSETPMTTLADQVRRLAEKWTKQEWEDARPTHPMGAAGICAAELLALLDAPAETPAETSVSVREFAERVLRISTGYNDAAPLTLGHHDTVDVLAELITAHDVQVSAEARRECGDWFLNWCDRAGVKVEESAIRQGLAHLPSAANRLAASRAGSRKE